MSRTLKFSITLIVVFAIGLLIGIFFTPPVNADAPYERIVEKPEPIALFDPPLKKGVENLNWDYVPAK